METQSAEYSYKVHTRASTRSKKKNLDTSDTNPVHDRTEPDDPEDKAEAEEDEIEGDVIKKRMINKRILDPILKDARLEMSRSLESDMDSNQKNRDIEPRLGQNIVVPEIKNSYDILEDVRQKLANVTIGQLLDDNPSYQKQISYEFLISGTTMFCPNLGSISLFF